MKKLNSKLSCFILTISVLTGCSTNLNRDLLSAPNQDISFDAFAPAAAIEPEPGETLINEEYYKKFPDKDLAWQLSEIEKGNTPVIKSKFEDNDPRVQGFFSIFNRKVTIDIYDSYGTPENFIVSGRVYKKRKVSPVNTGDSKFKNVFRSIKYFVPDAIENTELNVITAGKSASGRTDKKGFFRISFSNTGLKPGINNVSAKLNTSKYEYDIPNEEVAVDTAQSDKISIISDIDDTIKHSSVQNKIDMVKKILTGNYKTDKALPGVSALYRGITSAQQGTGFVHYVSGSPVQLNGRIQDFLKYNSFPQGSVDLKQYGKDSSDLIEYKLSRIRPIFKAFPNKRFVLFGDNSQKDPEIYLKLRQEFPGRIIGIYINNVRNEAPNHPGFKEVILTRNAADAARDLFNNGFISRDVLNKVISEVG